ncbi:MAG: hypothetical protein J6P73_06245 [Bacteroidales bacterium]|nr:hypothetical protein [Bacteroidales bacterium]
MRKNILLLLLAGIGLASMAQQPSISHLDINNVRATILGDGSYYVPQDYDSNTGLKPCSTWEVPTGSGKETIFQHALWFAGMDNTNIIHVAAQRFKQIGQDFWTGPLKTADASIDAMTSLKFNHIWNLTRAEIDQFIANHGNSGYQIPDDILTWPAHGDEGYAANLAPFVDVNSDGRYNPADGDYPDIKGDQCLFFIFNDNFGPHTETEGNPLGLEVHAMVYGFGSPSDEALSNTVFVNYKFYNRSANNYRFTYLGLWTDWDIGEMSDDYVGCDVQRNSCFAYNGTPVDGDGGVGTYGDNPPLQALTVLNGPDGLGMTGFIYHNNDNSPTGDPRYGADYFLLLQGQWKDGTCMQYGGNGYPGLPGVVGPACKYMFPGDTDPDNIGTGGVAPGGGYNANGKYWTEEECENQPGDRRGLASVGPFDFPAGSMKEVDYALITVWGDGNHSAFERKGEFIDHIKSLFSIGFKK